MFKAGFGCSLHLQNIVCLLHSDHGSVLVVVLLVFLMKGKCLDYTVTVKRNASLTITSTLFSYMPFHVEQIASCFLGLAITSVRCLANTSSGVVCSHCHNFFSQTAKWFLLLQTFV